MSALPEPSNAWRVLASSTRRIGAGTPWVTGWLNVTNPSVEPLLLASRRELEDHAAFLRSSLPAFSQKAFSIWEAILELHVGHALEIRPNDYRELSREIQALPFLPELLDFRFRAGLDQPVLISHLGRRLNDLMLLSLSDKLFSAGDVGWVRLSALPGWAEPENVKDE